MGITIFFGIMSVAMIIGTAIFVRKNNRLYNFKHEEGMTPKKQKKNIKNIWGIDMIKDGVITVQGQHSIIVEIGTIEYNLLNDDEQENIDNLLTRLCKTISYKMQIFSTIVKVDTNDKIDEIRENIQGHKNLNMVEYGKAIIEYLEEIMQSENLYVRKNYLIFSSFEAKDKARSDLLEFYVILKKELSKIRISCNILDEGGIIELIHRELNKNATENIENIIMEGGLDIYVKGQKEKGEEVVDKKQEAKESEKEQK